MPGDLQRSRHHQTIRAFPRLPAIFHGAPQHERRQDQFLFRGIARADEHTFHLLSSDLVHREHIVGREWLGDLRDELRKIERVPQLVMRVVVRAKVQRIILVAAPRRARSSAVRLSAGKIPFNPPNSAVMLATVKRKSVEKCSKASPTYSTLRSMATVLRPKSPSVFKITSLPVKPNGSRPS
jgi:hypothetical protein